MNSNSLARCHPDALQTSYLALLNLIQSIQALESISG